MLFEIDAVEVARQIRTRETTVTAMVQRALDNIHQYNDALNAVNLIQDDALEIARQYDERLAQDDNLTSLPPFYGVPILLKDLGQDQAGYKSTSGSALLKDYVPQANDHFVQAILDAGFIVVGRSNVPEFGFKNQSDSRYTGAVRNPIDTSRTPGGSSGGAAAALKAGLVPAVTASDGGGSIRIPASYSGLIGLKPTRGRTPVGPGDYRKWQGASIDFVLNRTVRDTWEILKAIQIEQVEGAFYCPMIEEEVLTPLDRSLNIAYTYDVPGGYKLDAEARKALDYSVEQLRQLGHQLVEVSLPFDHQALMRTYFQVNAVETHVFFTALAQGMQRDIEYDDVEPISWAFSRTGINVTGADYSRAFAVWDHFAVQMEAFFKQYDLFLTPTNNGPAFEIGQIKPSEAMIQRIRQIDTMTPSQQQDLILELFDTSFERTPYTTFANLSGQPAISLPMYTTADKLPIGMQAWAGRGQEYLLLQLALQLEEANLLNTNIVQ